MPHYRVEVDTETADRVGASGTFQVIGLHDEAADVDRSALVNSGTHYLSSDQLKADIAKATGVAVGEITLDIEIAEDKDDDV